MCVCVCGCRGGVSTCLQTARCPQQIEDLRGFEGEGGLTSSLFFFGFLQQPGSIAHQPVDLLPGISLQQCCLPTDFTFLQSSLNVQIKNVLLQNPTVVLELKPGAERYILRAGLKVSGVQAQPSL